MRLSAKKADAGALNRKQRVITDAFIFRWGVNEAGYQWARGIMDGKPRLVARFEPGKGVRLTEPPKGVFAEFARLSGTEKDIKVFADKYGDLFNTYDVREHAAHDGTVSGGASIKRWQSEIGDMRILFDLWEHIKHHRTTELNKIIRWKKTKDGHKAVSYVLETPTRKHDVTLAHSAIGESGLSRFNENDVLLPARCALQEEINLRLNEHPTVPRLVWTPDTPESSGGYYQRIIFTPPNLLAAMWLRFAQAITGELQLHRCAYCGTYYQVGPGGRRADSTTCKNSCRQQKYQKPK
jgi:hypothetical protein